MFVFGVHWFDFVTSLTGRLPNRVAGPGDPCPRRGGEARDCWDRALMDFGAAQASLIFDAATRFGSSDNTYVAGTTGA